MLYRNDDFEVRAKHRIIFVQLSSFVTIKLGKFFLVLLEGFSPCVFLYYFCEFKCMAISPFDPTEDVVISQIMKF